MTQRRATVTAEPGGGIITDMRNLGIRISDDLHAWLRAEAEREHRSLNGQVTHLLERARELTEHERAYLPGREPPPSPR